MSFRRFLATAASFSAVTLLLVSTGMSQKVSVLYNFSSAVGANPINIALTQGRDGQLYGTTVNGGASGLGSIFKISTTGHATALHSFNGTDGSQPWAGLTLGTDGNFYGTTFQGGTTGNGVVFKMTPTGTLTVLHNFVDDGIDGILPMSAPILATDGNFYGTTQIGGANFAGAVYKLTPAGVLTIIYNMDSAVGSYAAYSPTQGNDGNLYIATLLGGSGQCGSVIKISTAGVLKNNYSLDCAANGGNPGGSLFQGSDGNFYGTAYNGGANSLGVLFKLSRTFSYTVLHSFGNPLSEGTNPSGGVIEATDGNLYGLAYNGGTFGDGTVFNSSLSGTSNTLNNWSSNVAAQGQLTQHTSGGLYGVTYQGGTQNLGTVFSLNAGLRPFVELVNAQGKAGRTVEILGQGFGGTTSVTFNGIPATSFKVVTGTYVTAVIPVGASSGPVVVTTPGGTLTSNRNFRVIP
jgi:uncharacterized repeat protein (TIGR03803 family)